MSLFHEKEFFTGRNISYTFPSQFNANSEQKILSLKTWVNEVNSDALVEQVNCWHHKLHTYYQRLMLLILCGL